MVKKSKNLYDKVDDSIMYAVNKGVKVWNYTTGRTKTDLANLMLYTAPVLEIGGASRVDPFLGTIITITSLLDSFVSIKMNKIIEKKEEKAASSNAKSLSVERYKEISKKSGTRRLFLNTPLATLVSATAYKDSGFGPVAFGTGLAIRSLSDYVIRADYLPPKKGKFEELKEDLIENLKKEIDWNPLPAPQPSLEPVRSLNKSIEDYLKNGF